MSKMAGAALMLIILLSLDDCLSGIIMSRGYLISYAWGAWDDAGRGSCPADLL